MKKTLISGLLALTLAVSLTPGALAAAATQDEAAQALAALDIMVGDETGDLQLSRSITRAEFTKLVIAASPYRDKAGAAASVAPYPDVPRTHWAAPYVQTALQASLGNFGPIFIAVSMALFAFTTLIGNYYYCEGCMRFIFKRTPSKTFLTVFRVIAAIIVMLGAVISMQLAWDTADLFQALMVVINIPVILILARPALAALKDYMDQRKAGKEPEFKAASINLKDKTDFWN